MNNVYKTQARRLRAALAEQGHDVGHSEALELVAASLGRRNWNVLAAEYGQASRSLFPVPDPWQVVNSFCRESYEMGSNPDDRSILVIRSRLDATLEVGAFGSLMAVHEVPLEARRFVLSAEISTQDVQGSSIWARLDAKDGRVLAFDNLMRPEEPFRGLSGTTAWTKLSVSLDFVPGTTRVNLGVMLKGCGAMQARAISMNGAPISVNGG